MLLEVRKTKVGSMYQVRSLEQEGWSLSRRGKSVEREVGMSSWVQSLIFYDYRCDASMQKSGCVEQIRKG